MSFVKFEDDALDKLVEVLMKKSQVLSLRQLKIEAQKLANMPRKEWEIMWRGRLSNSLLSLVEHPIVKDGQCGYHCLGYSLFDIVLRLFKFAKDPVYQHFLACEMYAAFVEGTLPKEIDTTGISPSDDRETIIKFFSDPILYMTFLQSLLNNRDWLTYQLDQPGLIDAIANAFGIEVFIWGADENEDQRLNLRTHIVPTTGDIINVVHLLHTEDNTHFNLLEIVKKENFSHTSSEEKETGSSEDCNVRLRSNIILKNEECKVQSSDK